MLRKIVKEKITSPEKRSENLLDQAIDDMEKEKFLSEDFIVKLLFAILFASFETSVSVLLALKLLAEHPAALQELTVCKCTRTFFFCPQSIYMLCCTVMM